MNLKCTFSFHTWKGCTCTKCGKTRDEDHIWGQDCEECSACGNRRGGFHSWKGCKCAQCAKTRDEGHDWSKDCGTCLTCKKKRVGFHSWKGGNCAQCGKTRPAGAAGGPLTELIRSLARGSTGARDFMRMIEAHEFLPDGGSLLFGRVYQRGTCKAVLGVVDHIGPDLIWHLSVSEELDTPIVDIVDEGEFLT